MVQNCLWMYHVLQRYGRSKKFDTFKGRYLFFADYPTIMGFEPLVNQRLLPPTFPRYTVIRSREEALGHIEGLLYRLQIVTTVPELTTFHIIMVQS